jgi:hypothetical protein
MDDAGDTAPAAAMCMLIVLRVAWCGLRGACCGLSVAGYVLRGARYECLVNERRCMAKKIGVGITAQSGGIRCQEPF